MILITKRLIERHSKISLNDLKETTFFNVNSKTNDWFLEDPNKQVIHQILYGDLYFPKLKRSVLDVGGGITPYTKLLSKNNFYCLSEIFVHDDYSKVMKIFKHNKIKPNLLLGDWAKINKTEFDLIIANDIFPNADQRLDLFLKKFLIHQNEIRLSLTFFTTPISKFYTLKRVDAEEIMTIEAYSDHRLKMILREYKEYILNYNERIFSSARKNPSVYSNGRQIILVTLRSKNDN